MPNVPKLPGVPALSSYSATSLALLTVDAVGALLFGLGGGSQWGIFLDGDQVVEYDNMISFEFKQDFPISDYPVEDGGFQSYDKVQLPSDIHVGVSRGGSDADRQEFFESISDVMSTTDLYDVVTPERVFLDYNFVHQDYKRAADRGVGLPVVNLWLTEVRVTSTAVFTDTQQPGVAGQQNTGNVQPQTPDETFQQRYDAGQVR